MTTFAARYRACFDAQLRAPTEHNLQAAYDLGREAVEAGLSILDLAMAHHAALLAALQRDPGIAARAEATVRAAEDFFLESISAFEMVQRGFLEARDVAAAERRQAELLRRLSDFLADASLALHASDSMEEMLSLVCEQARDLVAADCCLITTGTEPQSRFRAASYPKGDLAWTTLAKWFDISKLDSVVRASPSAVRLEGDRVRELMAAPGADALQPPVNVSGSVGAALLALDGRAIGSLHLFNRGDRRFTQLDQAVVSHLAQMAAAALDRVQLYRRAGGGAVEEDRADGPQ